MLRPTVLFATLFAAALAATVLVVGSRSPELVLEVTAIPKRITPNGDHYRDKAEITFFVREPDAAADVYIVGRDLEPIRTLAEDVDLSENEHVTYLWDANTDEGEPAPVGRYRLRVVLPESDRDMVFPRRIDLVDEPPRRSSAPKEKATPSERKHPREVKGRGSARPPKHADQSRPPDRGDG